MDLNGPEHYDKLVHAILIRPVLLDLLGQGISRLVSSKNRSLSRIKIYICDFIHQVAYGSNRVILITKESSSEVMLTLKPRPLSKAACYAYQVTLTDPPISSVILTFPSH